MTTKQLREKRASVHGQMKAQVDKAKTENRAMNDDENRQFGEWDKEFETLTRQIETTQKVEEREALLATEQGENHTEDEGKKGGEERGGKNDEAAKKAAHEKAFRSYLRNGFADMAEAEKLVLRGVYSEIKEERAQNKGTASAGGYTVPTTLQKEIAIAQALWGGMRQASRIIKTSRGETINWPSVNDTGNVAQDVAEAGDVSSTITDITFGNVAINAYKIGDIIKVSRELLEDSDFDIESLVAELIGERIGRKENSKFTTGSGSSTQQGVVTGATSGKTAASATAITRSELIDLMHSVNPAYRVKRPAGMGHVGWMFNDTTLSLIKKLSLGSGDDTPLWQMSMRDGAPDTLEGMPYIINQDMANAATTTKPILFGNFSNFIIRDAGNMLVRRLDERYAETDQVGFIVFERVDSRLVNPGNNPIKFITMA